MPRRQTSLRKHKHRDPVEQGCSEGIPEWAAAKTQPENKNEGRTDHGDEEAIAACCREPKNAHSRRFWTKNRQQRQNDQRCGDERKKTSRFPSPSHPIEHRRTPSDAAKGK